MVITAGFTAGPTLTAPGPRLHPEDRSQRSEWRGLASVSVSTVSACSSLPTWTHSKPKGAMSSRLLASLNPGECVELFETFLLHGYLKAARINLKELNTWTVQQFLEFLG